MLLYSVSILCVVVLITTGYSQDPTTISDDVSPSSGPDGSVTSETNYASDTSTASMTSSTATSGTIIAGTTSAVCDSQNGPAGISKCVQLSPAYNDYQWATCLSNDYIRLISNNNSHCQDPNAKYCWFQCMLENYNSMGPNIRAACRCSPNTSITSLALPSSCYSPDGSVCDWYSNCLASKIQCDNTSAGNAFQYGFNFCRMYLQYYKQLSVAGQQWMDSVRKCLLGCMVPMMRQYNTLTCDNITVMAMASQASCYLGRGCYGGGEIGGGEVGGGGGQSQDDSSDQSSEQSDNNHGGNSNSICKLPSSDLFQVVQMINDSFADYTAAGESLCGALNTIWKCPGRSWNSLHKCFRTFVVSIRYMSTSTTPKAIAAPYAVPSLLTSQISKSQNWGAKGIQSLGCLNHWPDNNNNQLVINVVVVPKNNKNCFDDAESNGHGDIGNQNNGQQNKDNKKNNGNQNNPGHMKKQRRKRSADVVDLDQVVTDFQNDVESGKVLLKVNDQPMYVTGAGVCDPSTCDSPAAVANVTVNAPLTPSSDVSDCDSQNGPAGVNECVQLSPTYNDYQWATCLSNDYIRLISANKDACQDPSAKYCWFQCMLENYNSMGPNIRGVCKCSPNTNTTSLALPSTCYSPDGSVCDWYSNCLAAKFQCNNTSAGNAFEYGFNFCRMYLQYYKQLSDAGQMWMDSVRKCLMGCMVPLLRPYNTMTCENATKLAMTSQASCYLGHGCYGGGDREDHDDDQGNWNSICNLPLSDFFQVVQMINDSFADYSAAGESLCGALNTMRSCASHRWKSIRSCVRAIVVNVKYMDTLQPTMAAPYAAPSRITSQIAQSQNWNAQGIQSLGCLTQWPSGDTSSQLTINVVVITKDNKNCIKQAEADGNSSQGKQKSQRKKRATTGTNLDQVVSDFQKAVQSGRVLINVDGKPVYVTGAGECDLMACSNVTAVSVSAPPTPAGSTRSAIGSTGLLAMASILLVAINRRMA